MNEPTMQDTADACVTLRKEIEAIIGEMKTYARTVGSGGPTNRLSDWSTRIQTAVNRSPLAVEFIRGIYWRMQSTFASMQAIKDEKGTIVGYFVPHRYFADLPTSFTDVGLPLAIPENLPDTGLVFSPKRDVADDSDSEEHDHE
jgi:hypothetical protein